MRTLRKIASNQIVLEDNTVLTLSVVVVQDGVVKEWYPLTEERPNTEWLAGIICLKRDERGALRAYYNDRMLE